MTSKQAQSGYGGWNEWLKRMQSKSSEPFIDLYDEKNPSDSFIQLITNRTSTQHSTWLNSTLTRYAERSRKPSETSRDMKTPLRNWLPWKHVDVSSVESSSSNKMKLDPKLIYLYVRLRNETAWLKIDPSNNEDHSWWNQLMAWMMHDQKDPLFRFFVELKTLAKQKGKSVNVGWAYSLEEIQAAARPNSAYVVCFYLATCPHCKNLVSMFQELIQSKEGLDMFCSIPWYFISATYQPPDQPNRLYQLKRFHGYPTMLVFENNTYQQTFLYRPPSKWQTEIQALIERRCRDSSSKACAIQRKRILPVDDDESPKTSSSVRKS